MVFMSNHFVIQHICDAFHQIISHFNWYQNVTQIQWFKEHTKTIKTTQNINRLNVFEKSIEIVSQLTNCDLI